MNSDFFNKGVDCPAWLKRLTAAGSSVFPLKRILSSQIVFYPGAGEDWQPLELFGGASAAHCFIFVDYLHFKRPLEVEDWLRRISKYKLLSFRELREAEIFPEGLVNLNSKYPKIDDFQPPALRWGVWAVLESESGAKISLCYLSCEALSAFMSLWPAEKARKAPYAVVLHDYGFGANWPGNIFGGAASPMYIHAHDNNLLPKWLLVGTEPWPGYVAVRDGFQSKGMQHNSRILYKKKTR